MHPRMQDLKDRKILVSDGAWGTMLASKGLIPGVCPEEWNLSRPNDISDIARAYAEAGSDLVGTNSFGASRFKLAHFGLAGLVSEINEAAAALTRKAIGEDKLIFASVGPTGKILLMGDVTEDELYEAFREQAVALEQGSADAICFETFSALDEACIAIRAVRENTALQIFCTFTFDPIGKDCYRTMMGVSPTDMATTVIEAGADVIGCNCGQGPVGMLGVVEELQQAVPDVPILVQPNAGLPQTVDGVTVFPETPENMAKYVDDLIAVGATILGGCCGTTPDHIRLIGEAARHHMGS